MTEHVFATMRGHVFAQRMDAQGVQVRLGVRCRQAWCVGPDAWEEVLLHVVGMTSDEITAAIAEIDQAGIDCQRCGAARASGTLERPKPRPEPVPTMPGFLWVLARSGLPGDLAIAEAQIRGILKSDPARGEAHVRELLDGLAELPLRVRRVWKKLADELGIKFVGTPRTAPPWAGQASRRPSEEALAGPTPTPIAFDDHCGRPLYPASRPFELRAEVLRILRNASLRGDRPPWHTLGARVLQVSKTLGWDTGLLKGVAMPGDVYMATVRAALDEFVAEGLARKVGPEEIPGRIAPDTLAICGEMYVAMGEFVFEPAPFLAVMTAACLSCFASGQDGEVPKVPVDGNGDCEVCAQRNAAPSCPEDAPPPAEPGRRSLACAPR